MWEVVARAAALDAGARIDPLARVDDLSVVHCQSWAYDDPSGRLAERLDLPEARRHESILAGTSPQRLIDAAAERMLAGGCEVALVVGGEALATRRRHDLSGESPGWSHPHPHPPVLPIDLDDWYLPTELAHGVLPAWLTFALLEQARWGARGALATDRDTLATLLHRLQTVAVGNPDAWFREPRTADELVSPSPGNRMVALPYTKRMTAFMDVDMAAANLLVTHAVADRWGIPTDHRVYLRGWGFARDSVHLGARADLTTSPAMRAATGEALSMAGLGADQIDVFDLYSCFGSAVQFAQDALGLAPDDPRPISLTGGLPYHGGPSSNYMGHSISHMADHLRRHPAQVGMVTGVGMHMTKHVAAVWSATPGPILPPAPHHQEQQWDAPASTRDVEVVDRAQGAAQVLAATVVHGGDGSADHAVAICELPEGVRCYAKSSDPDAIEVVTSGAWVDLTATLTPGADHTNELRWP
jgi:acetyl-CoA C-acetyltransferase